MNIPQKLTRFFLLFFLSVGGASFLTNKSQALPFFLTQQDPSLWVEQAQILYQKHEYYEAANIWQKLINLYQQQNQPLNQAMAVSNLALTYQELGKWDLAQKTLSTSLSLLENLENSPEQQRIFAQTLEIQGKLQRGMGDSQNAIKTWQQAAKIYQKLKEKSHLSSSETQNKINQAQALQDLGLYPQACRTLLEALKWEIQDCKSLTEIPLEKFTQNLINFSQQPDSVTKFDGLYHLGNVVRIIGNLQRAQILLEASLKVAKNLNLEREQSMTLLSLGNLSRSFVERQTLLPPPDQDTTILILKTQEALKFYQDTINLSPLPLLQFQAKLNQLSLLLESQAWLGVVDWNQYQHLSAPSLQTLIPNLPLSKSSLYAQVSLAKIWLKVKENPTIQPPPENFIFSPSQLKTLLENAHQQALILGDPKAQAYLLGTLGQIYEQSQQWKVAESLTQQAISLVSSYQNPDISYQLFWQLGRLKKAQFVAIKTQGNLSEIPTNLDSAIASYDRAFQTLQSLRSDLVSINREVQFSFRDSVEPVYRELVGLYIEKAKFLLKNNQTSESQHPLKLARNVIESLQLAELNNFFQDACVEVKNQQIDQLDPTAAIIYPIILQEQLEIIVSLPGGKLALASPNLSSEELQQTLKELRKGEKNASLQSTASGNNYLPLTQKVYQWLIQPFEPSFQQNHIKILVFVLDGELRNIPMSVLHDGKQYLLEKYAISLTPGLQLLNPESLSQRELKALLGGATNAPSFTKNSLNPLPGVEQELSKISQTIPNLKRENQTFTKDNLQTLISQVPFPVVHLATHGQFSSNAEKTFILDWNGQINVKDLDNLLRGTNQKRPIELLVLSACETVTGDNRAALGLAGVAVRAGARSTLATLWQVSDESTALLMSQFYQELVQKKEPVSKAEALRRAQLKLLQDHRYQHPFFWAPYVLVGNWK